jgi:HAD superfamily hydrolase (TIGR01509 family)
MEKILIKAICFDLDGVFFTEDSFRKFKKTISVLSNKPNIIDDVFHGEMMCSFKKGDISENNYWEYVRNILNINISNYDIYKILRDSYNTNREIIKIISNIKKSNIKTCICSNNFISRIRELDKKFNFLELFDTKILSYEVGCLKPHREIFQNLINSCQLMPNEILYSDDNETKLIGAKDIGITTYVYNTIDSFKMELKKYNILNE